MKYDFQEIDIDAPEHDCDINIKFPSGKIVTVQARPSNADEGYNGSLDIILPKNQCVTNWMGDDMSSAPPFSKQKNSAHERLAKQLVMELP